MINRFLNKMGIIRKGNNNIKGDSKPSPKVIAPNKKFLQDNEIGFIIAKMRQATYQGSEFELFYKVIQKLQNELPKKGK